MPRHTAVELSSDTLNYLNSRAAIYNGTANDMLRITPTVLQDSADITAFWRGHELSHIQSQEHAPHLADDWDNIIPEDPSANRSRGANNMTAGEQLSAQLDNWVDASFIALDPGLDDSLLP